MGAMLLCMAPFTVYSWPGPEESTHHQTLLLGSLERYQAQRNYILAYHTAQLYITHFPQSPQTLDLKAILPELKRQSIAQSDAERWRYQPSLDNRQQAYLTPLEGQPYQLFLQSSPVLRDQLIVFMGPKEYTCPVPCIIDINGLPFRATPFSTQPYALKFHNTPLVWKTLTTRPSAIVQVPELPKLTFRVQGYHRTYWQPHF